MAFDAFLKFVGPRSGAVAVTGESRDKTHRGELDIKHLLWGEHNPTAIGSASGGAGAGRALGTPLQIVLPYSAASAQLAQTCDLGGHYDAAVLTVRKAGTTPIEYLVVTFGLVFVSFVDTSGGSADDLPSSTIELVYGAIFRKVTLQRPDGSPVTPPVQLGWNFVANQPWNGSDPIAIG